MTIEERNDLGSPADAEQLMELRKVAQTALTWMEWWVEGVEVRAPLRSRDVLNQLRVALNPKQPEKETR